ncbi:MAG: 5-methyltetrahydrofolate--homocysteine methyltransferase, partial [Spirochaetaceae bacterium]
MKVKKYILSQLEKRVLILDGAMGTELVKRGMPTGVCPETWCIANPEVVSGVYSDYAESGSDIIYTATFGGNYCKLGLYNEKDVVGINRRLAQIARESTDKTAGNKTLVAGDIAPFGKFVAPFGEVSFEEAVKYSKLQIQGLLEGGVDMLVIETMMDIQEARAALIAARESCDLFVMVTMTFDETGHTLNGTDP